MRLHNMLCSSIPTVGLAGPPENRVQMFYLTEEPTYTLNIGLWVTQLFLLMRGKPNGQSSDVSRHEQYDDRIWSKGMSLGLKCGEIRGQNVEY